LAIVVLAILITIGIAALLRARTASNETSTIGGLHAINSAQTSDSAVYGGGNYATSLVILRRVPPGGNEGYISPEFGGSPAPQRDGYTFNIRPGVGALTGLDDCFGNQT
jgi:type II secretory pathway pseudopilin PulG